jgi:hypothetical protein
MNRKFLRLVSVAAVALAINFAMLPTAEARDLSGSRTALTHTSDLWSAAIAWLADLLPGAHATRTTTPSHLVSYTITPGDGGYRTNTGPCIDPLGIRCSGI